MLFYHSSTFLSTPVQLYMHNKYVVTNEAVRKTSNSITPNMHIDITVKI